MKPINERSKEFKGALIQIMGGPFEVDETTYLSVKEILAIINFNAELLEEFYPYDETDWIDGLYPEMKVIAYVKGT